jgi:hypothetical protein
MTPPGIPLGLVFALVAMPQPADAETPYGRSAAVLRTPPLAHVSAGWRALARAVLPSEAAPWAPPLPLETAGSPIDGTRSAHFRLDETGAGVWLVPIRPDALRADVNAWLARHGAQPLEAGVAEWHLPAAAPELEAACRTAGAWVGCQRPVGADGPRALARVLGRSGPSLDPAAGEAPGADREAMWHLRVEPPRMAPWVRRRLIDATEQRARLLDDAAKRRARARGLTIARVWADTLGEMPEIRVEGDTRARVASLSATVRFSPATWPSVEAWLGRDQTDPHLVGWSRTPALLQLWANVDARVAHRLMRAWLGQTVPGLRGDFGMLWLGVRNTCEGCGPRTDAWPALFPSAAAFEIGPPDPDSVMASLDGRTSTAGAHRVEIVTSAGPTELRLEHGTLFVTTGDELGAAASRRWSKCEQVRQHGDAVVYAKADLHAIRAALEVHDAKDEPLEVRKLHRTLELLSAALRPRRWIEIRLEPAPTRALRIEMRAVP